MTTPLLISIVLVLTNPITDYSLKTASGSPGLEANCKNLGAGCGAKELFALTHEGFDHSIPVKTLEQWPLARTPGTLSFSPIFLGEAPWRTFSLAHLDNNKAIVMIEGKNRVYLCTPSGELVHTITLPKDRVVTGMAYFPEFKSYVISSYILTPFEWSVDVFEQNGQPLGKVSDPRYSAKDLVDYRFMTIDDRIFATIFELGSEMSDWRLEEVTLHQMEDGLRIKRKHLISRREMNNKDLQMSFKKEWVVVRPHDSSLYALNQLSTRLARYEYRNREYEESGHRPWLTLAHAVAPKFTSVDMGKKDDPKTVRRKLSFTHVTGLYSWDDKFLVTYQSPNPKADDASQLPFVAFAQIIDENGQPCSAAGPLGPAHVIGVRNGRLLTFHNSEPKRFQIQTRSIDALLPDSVR